MRINEKFGIQAYTITPFAFVVTQVPFMKFYDYFTHCLLCVSFKCFEFELTNFCVEIVSTYMKTRYPAEKNLCYKFKVVQRLHHFMRKAWYTHILLNSMVYENDFMYKKERIFRHTTKRGASRKCLCQKELLLFSHYINISLINL